MHRNQTKYALIRILGNDLPPRHSVHQTERNVEFILKHEPPFANCEKVWVLNRIVDDKKKQRLADLIDQSAQRVVSIEFDRNAYQDACANKSLFEKVNVITKLNDARNKAIEIGRNLGAQWILPFDGNSIFSRPAWCQLEKNLARLGRKRCFVSLNRPLRRNFRNGKLIRRNPGVFYVPMYRVMDNSQFSADESSRPASDEQEPQVVMRRNCPLRFDPSFSYGKDSKVEFLKRAANGVKYSGQSYVPVDRKMCAGYVFRLASGVDDAELDINVRAELREKALRILVENVEAI